MWEPALASPGCAAPHPVKGLTPLETLLHSTFEKSWVELAACGRLTGFQYLLHLLVFSIPSLFAFAETC
jgi:hypothetical protein